MCRVSDRMSHVVSHFSQSLLSNHVEEGQREEESRSRSGIWRMYVELLCWGVRFHRCWRSLLYSVNAPVSLLKKRFLLNAGDASALGVTAVSEMFDKLQEENELLTRVCRSLYTVDFWYTEAGVSFRFFLGNFLMIWSAMLYSIRCNNYITAMSPRFAYGMLLWVIQDVK